MAWTSTTNPAMEIHVDQRCGITVALKVEGTTFHRQVGNIMIGPTHYENIVKWVAPGGEESRTVVQTVDGLKAEFERIASAWVGPMVNKASSEESRRAMAEYIRQITV